MRIVYHYFSMVAVVDFALKTLRERSPVGSDKHSGLYRDSHLVFIQGHSVPDGSAWRPGQQVEISNPVPYAHKIELGTIKLSVPAHVYEMAAPIVAAEFPGASVKFQFMPLHFSSAQAFSQSKEAGKIGHNKKLVRDWLAQQPALIITQR